MTDDDLDLELDEEPVRPRKPAPKPQPAPTAPPAAPAARAAGAPPAEPAKVAGVRKPGLFQRVSDQVSTHRVTWNWKTFLLLFVALIIVVAFAENWSPVRFYCFGLRFEMPKAVAFVLNAAIGALVMWFWGRRPAGDVESGR